MPLEMEKTILLASFIFPERLDWFLDYLYTKFSINKSDVFCYKNLDDDSKLIITFKFTIPSGQRVNLKNLFPSAVPIHKKGTTFYTINALNRLIDQESGGNQTNIDYKTVKIKWDDFKNKIIIINDKVLGVFNIERVF